MKNLVIVTQVFILFMFFSCDIKKSNVSPNATFVKVYESGNIDESYFPLSIIENGNSGYLILSALDDSVYTNFPRVHITSLTPEGNVSASLALPIQYTNPVPGWLSINNKNYFVCMDDVTLTAKLLEVSVSGKVISFSEKQLDVTRYMPVYSWSDGKNMILLSYNRLSKSSEIDLYDNNLNSVWSKSVSAVDDFENDVRLHLQKKGKEFPFFAGAIGTSSGTNDFFVNCLANYTMTLVFLSGSSGEVTGRLYAFQTGGAISSALYVNDTSYALSRYYTGDNFVNPIAKINKNIIQNTQDFQDIPLSQLKSDAKTSVIKYHHNDTDYILFASSTKNNQIVLLFFDPITGKQVYTHYLGYGNPIEVVQVIQTKDNGLAVLGKTWINERYQRIILYKLSQDQLSL
jgi:hypothetical protein